MEFQRLDIIQLINNSQITKLSDEFQSKLLDKIQNTFTNDQQQLFVASFYSYLNYNSKTDFVINLDDVWKWCGFSRKNDAKRVLEKHFTKDVDYKIFAPQVGGAKAVTETSVAAHKSVSKVNGECLPIRNLGGAGHNKETVLMTINTFKKFCLKAGTKKADEIHDYYIKLEELMQETLKEESDELRLQIKEKDIVLQEQNKKIELLEHKPHTHGFDCWKKGYVYLINDVLKPGHYKIGMATDPEKRVRNLNTGSSEKSLRLYYEIETYDIDLCERTIQSILQPFNIKGRKEWFYLTDDKELKYAIYIMNQVKTFLDNFNIQSYEDFCIYSTNLKSFNLPEIKKESDIQFNEKNIYKLNAQQKSNKTGNYKGVCFCKEKQKWKAELKKHYIINFLGYYDTELDAAKAYNDYALYLNTNEQTNYSLNEIQDIEGNIIIPIPRNIPLENNYKQSENKTSNYIGVSFDNKRNYYVVSIKHNNKTYHLGNNIEEIECAKLYNQQALYFNNNFNTNYVLNTIPNYTTIERNIYEEIQNNKTNKKSSKYIGVTFCKKNNQYRSSIVYNKKQIHIGFFDFELEAAKAYNIKALELNEITGKKKYKLNNIVCNQILVV